MLCPKEMYGMSLTNDQVLFSVNFFRSYLFFPVFMFTHSFGLYFSPMLFFFFFSFYFSSHCFMQFCGSILFASFHNFALTCETREVTSIHHPSVLKQIYIEIQNTYLVWQTNYSHVAMLFQCCICRWGRWWWRLPLINKIHYILSTAKLKQVNGGRVLFSHDLVHKKSCPMEP